MSQTSFQQRSINVQLQLGKGSFGNSGYNAVNLTGLRVVAQLQHVIGPSPSMAQLRVYGVPPDIMNQISVAGLQWQARNNKVIITASTQGNSFATVFNGTIVDCFPDFREMPNSALMISSVHTFDMQLAPVAPSSFSGPTSVAVIMAWFAKQAGFTLENNLTLPIILQSPYYPGTIIDQIYSCADAANIYCYVDTINKVLAIWPKTGARSGSIPVISPATGMISYPLFSRNKVQVRTLFNWELKFGATFQLQSSLTAANGTWRIIGMEHNISSQMPDGPWETDITAIAPNIQ